MTHLVYVIRGKFTANVDNLCPQIKQNTAGRDRAGGGEGRGRGGEGEGDGRGEEEGGGGKWSLNVCFQRQPYCTF